MIALIALNPIWITLGPIIVINGVLLISYLAYQLWGRKRLARRYEGAKDHNSKLLSSDTSSWWMWTTDPFVRLLVKLHIGPNTITIVGFAIAAVAGYLFSQGWFGYAGWTMIFGATFDIFDGRVARMTGRTTRSGAFFDAVLDRFSEGACMLGLAWYFRASWVLPVVIAALIGSYLVSYTRARAESMGVDCAVGTMQRPERIVYLGVAAIFTPVMSWALTRWWALPPPVLLYVALSAIALLTNGTAVYRMIYTMNALDNEDREGAESIPQILTKLSTPEGRDAIWERARYGYDRTKASSRRVVMMVAEGMRPELLARHRRNGDLPNIAQYLAEPGSAATAASVFPATEGPASVPFVTGCFPGSCDIPGVRWFDRGVPTARRVTLKRFRDYAGWGAYAMDGDLAKSVRTIFEYSRRAVNIFGQLNRGCGLVRDPAFFRMRGISEEGGLAAEPDAARDAAFHWFANALDRETDFVFLRLPPLGAASLDEDLESLDDYRQLDESVGRVVDLLRAQGMEEETALILSSDNGVAQQGRIVDLEAIVGCTFSVCRERRMRDWQSAEAIVLPSGTSMAHLFLRSDATWERPSFFEALQERGLVNDLLAAEGVAIVAGRSAEGGIVAAGRGGAAFLREDADGRITVHGEGSDPFGLGAARRVLDADAALAETWEGAHPDGIVQLLQLFRSRRTGDLVVSADAQTAFAPRRDGLTSGALVSEHLLVPAYTNVPLTTRRLRTADLFALALELLGIEPTHALDGRAPERGGVIAGEIAARS